MPTAREVREYNEAEALANCLRGTPYENYLDEYPMERVPSQSGLLCVKVGPIEVMEGENPKKPVIRDARTKRALKGSGRYKHFDKSPDTQLQNFRESPEYRTAFEQLFPAGGDVTDRGSLAWWFDQAWQAAEGSPQLVDCPHPEVHFEEKRKKLQPSPVKHVVAFKKEANLIFKMIELAVGKASQNVNINKKEHKLVESLEHRVFEVRLQGFDESEAKERRELIEGFGYELETPVEGV